MRAELVFHDEVCENQLIMMIENHENHIESLMKTHALEIQQMHEAQAKLKLCF